MTKGLPMKPSPLLEEIRAHQVEDDTVPVKDSHELIARCERLLQDRRDLLALISAQPGGEGVTREEIYEALQLTGRASLNLRDVIDLLSEMFLILPRPTSPDPARATEEREGK